MTVGIDGLRTWGVDDQRAHRPRGLVAFEGMPKRLHEDHHNARFLAEELGRIAGIRVAHRVETNIVVFDVSGTGLAPAESSLPARVKDFETPGMGIY